MAICFARQQIAKKEGLTAIQQPGPLSDLLSGVMVHVPVQRLAAFRVAMSPCIAKTPHAFEAILYSGFIRIRRQHQTAIANSSSLFHKLMKHKNLLVEMGKRTDVVLPVIASDFLFAKGCGQV